ncbi:hypothetical protein NTH44_003159 [Vibrio metoecus]|uniref:Uncharacterized protein n=2 Tax=Vibrionaceae TaxID=641 RepID=A0A0H3ZSS9_VIBSP|nr:hypothetical protein [Vibrio splendidus]AKN40566.1 hypothetical protein [Enterovibrio norvegicus]ELL0578554.1 hypothetical protein [Vibrio cholerae]HCT5077579.1 hypothetical protein [Vibrio cholerae]
MITLTGKEIKQLAELVGFEIKEITNPEFASDVLETEIDIVRDESGVIHDDGTLLKYKYKALFSEYQEEGVYPLGEPVTTQKAI